LKRIVVPPLYESKPLSKFKDLFRKITLAELDPGSGFIHQIDCLLRQKTFREVAARVKHSIFNGFIGVAHFMKLFKALFHATQDNDGFFLAWRPDFHHRKQLLQPRRGFYALLVFRGSGGADTKDTSPHDSGLDDIGQTEKTGSLGQIVQSIDKKKNSIVICKLIENPLQVCFE